MLKLIKGLGKRLTALCESSSAREWRKQCALLQSLDESNAALRRQMKPQDGQHGYIVDRGEGNSGVILAIDPRRLIQCCPLREQLDGARLEACRRAIVDNHNLVIMPSLLVDAADNIQIVEGNHRLGILSERSVVLVHVLKGDCNEVEFARHVNVVKESCGVKGVEPKQMNDVVYCRVSQASFYNPYDRGGRHFTSPALSIWHRAPYHTPIACARS